jgi:predicted transcriptional regulator
MELPQEIEIWYVIPAIRKALVAELKKQGLRQKDIAKLLGITESAVSQYGKDKRAVQCYAAFTVSPMKEELSNSAKRILAGQDDPSLAVKEINRLCRIIREKKIICDIHRKQNPKMESCGVCYE